MPEIAEVEAFKYIIQKNCLKKEILNVFSQDKSLIKKISFVEFKRNLINHSFLSVQRKGKYLFIEISSSEYKLILHFGLTGYLVYSKDINEKVRFSRVTFIFNKSILHFADLRKFGKLYLLKNLDDLPHLKNLGIDPLKLKKSEFIKLTSKYKRKNIKAFLMDQSIISGIGNEYSDEILFQSSVDPHHKVSDLSKEVLLKIYSKMQSVLKYSIKLRVHNFSNDNQKNFKSSFLQAHRHKDMLCPKNKNHRLKKSKIAGRSSYYCPNDQQ